MAEIRTTSSVQVTEALAESCRSATGEEIEPNTWMSLEFRMEPGKRGVAAAARIVIEPEEQEGVFMGGASTLRGFCVYTSQINRAIRLLERTA